MRKTHALIQVATALLEDPGARQWGYELSRRARVRSGVLHPILRRMYDEGWLDDGWEDPADTGGARPARRYYELTEHGERELRALLAEARCDERFNVLIKGFA